MELLTIKYEVLDTFAPDAEALKDIQEYLEDREAWLWKEGWTLELVKKDGNIYTFRVDGEYADESL